jgi:hypothetical protein
MNKNLHNIDQIFRAAQEQVNESPSEGAWKNISSSLDEEDLKKYKRRSGAWKKTAIVLAFLLGGFVIYESKMLRSDELVNGDITDNDDSTGISQQDGADQGTNNKTGKPQSRGNQGPHINSTTKYIFPDNHAEGSFQSTTATGLLSFKSQAGNSQKPGRRSTQTQGNGNDVFLATNISDGNFPVRNGRSSNGSDNSSSSNYSVQLLNPFSVSAIGTSAMATLTGQPKVFSFADLLSSSNISSTRKKEKLFHPSWTISGFASAELAMYKLDDDLPDNYENKNEISDRENHGLAFAGGVLLSYQFSKHWSLGTGLSFSTNRIMIDPQTVYAYHGDNNEVSYKLITSSGYAFFKPGFANPSVGDSLISTTTQHDLQYVGVPLVLHYTKNKKRWSAGAGVGVVTKILSAARLRTEVENTMNKEAVYINSLKGQRGVYFAFVADARLGYSVNNHVSVSVAPAFKYALNSITKNNVVKTYPYSIGAAVSIAYRF